MMYKQLKGTGLLVVGLAFWVNSSALYAQFGGTIVYVNTIFIDVMYKGLMPGNAASKYNAVQIEAEVLLPAGSHVKTFCSNGGEDDVLVPEGGEDTTDLETDFPFSTERGLCIANGGNTCVVELMSTSPELGGPSDFCNNDNWDIEKLVPSEAKICLKLFYCHDDQGELAPCLDSPPPQNQPADDGVQLFCMVDPYTVDAFEIGDPRIPAECIEIDPPDPDYCTIPQ